MDNMNINISELSTVAKKNLRKQIEDQICNNDLDFMHKYTQEEKDILFTNRIIKLLKERGFGYQVEKKPRIKREKNEKNDIGLSAEEIQEGNEYHVCKKKELRQTITNELKKNKENIDNEIAELEQEYENIKLTNKEKKVLRIKMMEEKIIERSTKKLLDDKISQKIRQIEQSEQELNQLNELIKNKSSQAINTQTSLNDEINTLLKNKQQVEQELIGKQKAIETIINGAEDECLDKMVELGISAKCSLCLCLIKKNCVLIPCYHTSFCEDCLIGLYIRENPSCPICRKPVQEYKRLYQA